MVDRKRRLFLRASLVVGLAACAGLLVPRRLLAAVWPGPAFDAKTVPQALQALLGDAQLIQSAEVGLTVPELAENGAVVPVTVRCALDGIESVMLLVDKNPNALVARFDLAENTRPFIKTNIKMAETSNVIAVLKSGDKLYSTSKKVKVVLNGCGN